MPRPTFARLRRELRRFADPRRAREFRRFFQAFPGGYGHPDRFLGVRVPGIRAIAKEASLLADADLLRFLESPWHEERLLALAAWECQVRRAPAIRRARIARLYLRALDRLNNWDLVDLSAPSLLGEWLVDRSRDLLHRLASSPSLWRRRVAVIATFAFIRRGDFHDTLRLCRALLGDRHDLIHKACGWMLREVGKRDPRALRGFLRAHATRMPRTMLRYAIERLPAAERRRWLVTSRSLQRGRSARPTSAGSGGNRPVRAGDPRAARRILAHSPSPT